jgi:hypothetical protein
MKTNKFFYTVIGFITGIAAGISVVGLLSFSGGPATPVPGGGLAPITTDMAHSYLLKYLSDAAPVATVVKGFTIDKIQLDAMNAIAKENPDLAGFRIYMGKDNAAKRIGIVIGVDANGNDAIKNTVFSTDAAKLSPCPPICDVTSPITLDK